MVIEVQNLNKRFGEKEVLQNLSFTAESGKALGLLGRNGAGKTTTIRIIMGVFFPDSGTVLADGKPLNRDQLQIGYLPEERGLYPKKKITEQLVYFGMLRGLTAAKAKESAARWLDRMGMSEYADKKLETLSKGNQQKIQLAATLLCNPQLVILDEPFSGLDPVNAMLLKDVIREMIDKGSAVIFSSHQMNYIEEFCDDIVILNQGKSVLSGSIHDIKKSYPRNNIRIFSEQPEKLSAELLQGCGGIITAAEPDSKNAQLLIRLKDASQKQQLLEAALNSKTGIDGFQIAEPSLNDIFVEYAEGSV